MSLKHDPKYLEKVDLALMQRLFAGCDEAGVTIEPEVMGTLLYRAYDLYELKRLLARVAKSVEDGRASTA